MNVHRIQSQLQHQVGRIIQTFHVELWAESPNCLNHPVSVGMEFLNGDSLILSCAGDGGLAVQKGQLKASTGNLHLQPLRQVSGMVIESIECDCDSITLTTKDHRVRIANRDDELEIAVNGCDVNGLVEAPASP